MFRLGLACLAFVCSALVPALGEAAPSRIILLRHAEKKNDYQLCETGLERARAIAHQYLGANATEPLLAPGETPAAVFAVTLHVLETAAPTAVSWQQPVVLYAVLPEEVKGFTNWHAGFPSAIADRNVWLTRSLMEDPRWTGKTVIVFWEHQAIADEAMEKANPGRPMTLRQTLHLDRLPDVPRTWPENTYDYFWLIDLAPDGTPVKLTTKKQEFKGRYANLPANDWDTPDGLDPAKTGCQP